MGRLAVHELSKTRDSHQIQIQLDGAHDHHLARDVVHTHAQQGSVTLLEPQEVASRPSAGKHTTFLDTHHLGVACRAAGVHLHSVATIVPLIDELFYRHFF